MWCNLRATYLTTIAAITHYQSSSTHMAAVQCSQHQPRPADLQRACKTLTTANKTQQCAVYNPRLGLLTLSAPARP